MARADLELVIEKYRKLFSVYHEEDAKETGAIAAPTAPSQEVLDAYLDPERFIRAPIDPVQQSQADATSAKEQFVVGSLFAGVDQDEYLDPTSTINQRAHFEESALRLEILAAGIASRMIAHERDLMQMYDPAVGMYSTQALFTPPRRLFSWGGAGKQKQIHIRPEQQQDLAKGKGRPQVLQEIKSREFLSKSIRPIKKKKESGDDSQGEEADKKKKRGPRIFRPSVSDDGNAS